MKISRINFKLSKRMSFLSILFVMMAACFLTPCCFAATESSEDVQTVSSQSEFSVGRGLGYLAAAIAISAGSIGAGKAVASSAPAALGAFSENPASFGKTIVFVALGEGVSILSFIVSMMIINNLAK